MKNRALISAFLAVALVAAVSPVVIMVGCDMAMGIFEAFGGCEHSVINTHIDEAPTTVLPVLLAVVAMVGLALASTSQIEPLRIVSPHRSVVTDDLFAGRLRV